MNARSLAVHAVANLVHAAIATGAAIVAWQTVTIRHTPTFTPAVAAFVLAVLAFERPFTWITTRLTTTPQPATTGPEFAKRHHHDSSEWSAADFETAYNLAEMDAQPAWTALTTKPTTLTPAA